MAMPTTINDIPNSTIALSFSFTENYYKAGIPPWNACL
ncbi:hypothetical protein B4119_3219 [Parageobacillus caldoxylosilyticus]|mgnify:CR=1 FL=1|jgi:hypothetical protein|uniref:Uncharacterized protein n=1 Tax=Saccharococcus caldoxylosilyticus TaxID=81408 RepID=A0A150M525_9BACL|nr:hypothetical protein B4119_3219 [Parageobacillus caldoxylosilyticus]MBB3851947.1 hypothetical protein [Parageobacillus caldoxylosilyticus]